MLECIKFGDCKINTIQIEDEWFVFVCHIDMALGVSSDTLKVIVRHHIYLSNINFQEKKLILMTIMMALNYSPQYLVHAGLY